MDNYKVSGYCDNCSKEINPLREENIFEDPEYGTYYVCSEGCRNEMELSVIDEKAAEMAEQEEYEKYYRKYSCNKNW